MRREMQDIVFWKNHPSLHDHELYRSMSSYYDVTLVCDRPTPQNRIVSSGWSTLTGLRTFFLSSQASPKKFVGDFLSEHTEAIHVLSGLRSCQSVRFAMPQLLKLPSPRIVISQEAPTKTTGLRKFFQSIYYRLALAKCQKKVSALFTMGEMGINAYKRLGFPAQKIHPIMYSYPGHYPPLPPPTLPTLPLKVIYVGEAIRAKGVQLLLDAVKNLSPESVHLTFAGSDPQGILARAQAEPLWQNRIRVLGVIPNHKILDIISQHDLLILPSFNDGWGMVVTEALIAGIGAIVTDACGSQDIPRHFQTGLVIPSESRIAITEALEKAVQNPQLVLTWKVNARIHRDQTRPEQIAKSMHQILDSLFPDSPSTSGTPF